MSEIDVQALQTNFEAWRRDRVPDLPRDKAFERYTVEQILKDYEELSDEDIDSGLLGGGDDGGVDGVYFFVGRTLIQEGTDVPDSATTAELYLIQAKNEKGFGETAVEKMADFTRDLLDYTKPVDRFTYLNSSARTVMARFREKYNTIVEKPHTLTVRFYYATRSDTRPNAKVKARVENLKDLVHERLSQAVFQFSYWGCKELLAAVRTAPLRRLAIPYTKSFDTSDGCVVALVELKNFAEFLKDDKGELRRSLLEPNVRDYQSKRNPVNSDIRTTLDKSNPKIDLSKIDFWWLNNGVTLLADSCSITAGKLVIDQPEIVNGLQTTQEIFDHFKNHLDTQDTRNVLIRVIVPPENDDQMRNIIIKATNYQTPVDPLSLHAMEPLHFDIEDRLALYGLFYDRRKGHYRQLKKKRAQIVSQKELARAIIAIILQRPDDARARPETLTKKEDTYPTVFNDRFNRDVFAASILLDRQVAEYLSKQANLARDEQGDIRFYVDMLIACELAQKAKPTPDDIAALVPKCAAGIPEDLMSAAVKQVHDAYRDLVVELVKVGQIGAGDKVAKGTELKARLIAEIEARFPKPTSPSGKPSA